jgi:hypothetical protein
MRLHSATNTGFTSTARRRASGRMRRSTARVMHPVPVPSCTMFRARSKLILRSSSAIRYGELARTVPDVRMFARCLIRTRASRRQQSGHMPAGQDVCGHQGKLANHDPCK